jgi:hypothetical protein
MTNGSARNSSSSSSSQVRRAAKLSLRTSIVGTPSRALRQSSTRRPSSLIDPNLDLINTENFDWNFPANLSDEGDTLYAENPLTIDDILDAGYANEQVSNGALAGQLPLNYYNNPNVAVPSTPHNAAFPHFNRPMAPPMLHPQGTAPLTRVDIGGQILMLEPAVVEAVCALISGVAQQAMLTDGKRSSVPKSPGLRKHRHSQFRGQAIYDDTFIGSEDVDPAQFGVSAFHDYPISPEPSAYYDGLAEAHQPQPYYQSTQWQGAPSPGSRRFELRQPEPEYVQSAFPQQVSQPLQSFGFLEPSQGFGLPGSNANDYQTRENHSLYAPRNHSSGHGRRNPAMDPTKSGRQDEAHASVSHRDTTHQYQKPKHSSFNPEVRINKTTKGLTTRTAKINDYDPRANYIYTPHPLGTLAEPHGAPWKGRYTHRYKDSSLKEYDGGDEIAIYELENREMSASEIEDFILNYPRKGKLTLRIQVAPGDSGRRYRSGADKCRFENCPNRKGGVPATIKHGWYRVAFDERGDEKYDPFAANCGFVHLYCLERFLDFEYICRKANVIVDFRNNMPTEPNNTFAAAFQNKQLAAGGLADEFVHHARMKVPGNIPRQRGDNFGVRQMREFANYPVPRPYNEQAWDANYAFEDTLSYHMTLKMEEQRPAAQMAQFASKGLGPTVLSVHRGDLAMFAEANTRDKQLKTMNKARGKRKGKSVTETYAFNGNSSFDIEVRRRIERAEYVLKKRALEPKSNKRARKDADDDLEDIEEEEVAPTRFGKEPWEASEDESDVEIGRPMRTGTRRSKRNQGKQPDYRDSDERQPERPRKRSFQQYEQSQQDTNQYSYRQAQQYQQNAYSQNEYAQDYVEEPAPKRKRPSIVPPTGYVRAYSYQPGQQWDPTNNDYQVDLDDLLNLHSPRSPERKRKRASHDDDDDDDDEQQPGRAPRRRLSSLTNSIMRHQGSDSRTPSGSNRHASFNNHPVSKQKMFHFDAPPHAQPRMLKELKDDATSPRGSKTVDSPGRKLRSGRSFSAETFE